MIGSRKDQRTAVWFSEIVSGTTDRKIYYKRFRNNRRREEESYSFKNFTLGNPNHGGDRSFGRLFGIQVTITKTGNDRVRVQVGGHYQYGIRPETNVNYVMKADISPKFSVRLFFDEPDDTLDLEVYSKQMLATAATSMPLNGTHTSNLVNGRTYDGIKGIGWFLSEYKTTTAP